MDSIHTVSVHSRQYYILMNKGALYMMNQHTRIHQNQDPFNCYIDEGDIVEICTNNEVYTGEIVDIGLRLQRDSTGDGIHPCITIGISTSEAKEYDDMAMFWTEHIDRITLLRFGNGKKGV